MTKTLIFLLLIILPCQLGKHFWPSFSYVLGLKIDYLSPVIYLQDIFILLLIGYELWVVGRVVGCGGRSTKSSQGVSLLWQGDSLPVYVCLYLLLVFVNIYFSINKYVSVFQWLRITEFLILAVIISKNKEFVWKKLIKIIPFWLVGEFVLSVLQVWRQSSVGGLVWFLGERSFNISTPGIAKASWMGQVFLRPYGTFSHPNSMSGFVLVCLILLLAKEKLSLFEKIAATLGFFLIILCFSRTVWLAVLIFSLFFLLQQLRKGLKRKLSLNFFYFFIIAALLTTTFLFQRTAIEKNSFDFRRKLMAFSLKTIEENPLFGIGANSFIVKLGKDEAAWQWMSFLQPVHNIYLLVASETGLIGLGLFAGFIFFAVISLSRYIVISLRKESEITRYRDSDFQSLTLCLVIALSAILFTGLFDHYWLTLIQNQLLFIIVLSFSLL